MRVIIVSTNRGLVRLHSLKYINYSFQSKFKKRTNINFLHIFREKSSFTVLFPFRFSLFCTNHIHSIKDSCLWLIKRSKPSNCYFLWSFSFISYSCEKRSLGKINIRHLWANAILTEKGSQYTWSDIFLNGSPVFCCQGWFLFLCLWWPESTCPLACSPACFSFKIPVRSLKKEGVLKWCGSDKN